MAKELDPNQIVEFLHWTLPVWQIAELAKGDPGDPIACMANTVLNNLQNTTHHPDFVEPNKPWEEWTDDEQRMYLENEKFFALRKIEGEWCGLLELATTRSICMGIERLTSFKYRWCFKNRDQALIELDKMTAIDQVPTLGTFVAHRHGFSQEPLWQPTYPQ